MRASTSMLLATCLACTERADTPRPAPSDTPPATVETDATHTDTPEPDTEPTRSFVLDDTGTIGEDTSPLSATTAPETGLCSEDGWCWVWPLPHRVVLTSVVGAGATDVWAAGAAGVVHHWDGASVSMEVVPGANGRRLTLGPGGAVCVTGEQLRCRADGVWEIVPTPAGHGPIVDAELDPEGRWWLLADRVIEQTEAGWTVHAIVGDSLTTSGTTVLVVDRGPGPPNLHEWNGTTWQTTTPPLTNPSRPVIDHEGTTWIVDDRGAYGRTAGSRRWTGRRPAGATGRGAVVRGPRGILLADDAHVWALYDGHWTSVATHDVDVESAWLTPDNSTLILAGLGALAQVELATGAVTRHVGQRTDDVMGSDLAPIPGGGVLIDGTPMRTYVSAHAATFPGPAIRPFSLDVRGGRVWGTGWNDARDGTELHVRELRGGTWQVYPLPVLTAQLFPARRPDAMWGAPVDELAGCVATRYLANGVATETWPPRPPGTAYCTPAFGPFGTQVWALGATLEGTPRVLHHGGTSWAYWNLPEPGVQLVRHPTTHRLGALGRDGWRPLEGLLYSPSDTPTLAVPPPPAVETRTEVMWASVPGDIVVWDGLRIRHETLPVTEERTVRVAVTADDDDRAWAITPDGVLTRAPVP